jgi:hypothetical protein
MQALDSCLHVGPVADGVQVAVIGNLETPAQGTATRAIAVALLASGLLCNPCEMMTWPVTRRDRHRQHDIADAHATALDDPRAQATVPAHAL